MTDCPETARILREMHPDRFCRATVNRGRFAWTCYEPKGHTGPHHAGNADNEPIYRSWFDVIDGGAA